MHVRKLAATLAAVPLLLASSIGVAFADTVENDIDAVGDSTIAAGQSTDIGYKVMVEGTGLDGQGGCNASDGTPLTITLSVPTDVTVTGTTLLPNNSLRFSSCNALQTLSFSATKPGDYPIRVSSMVDSATTGGTYRNLADWTLRVSAPSNTAPNVSVTGVAQGASYDKGNVPTAMCQVTDAEDGNSSSAAALSAITGPYASDGIGSQTASCSYTDAGQLTASDSKTYSIVDPSAPVIDYTLDPTTPPSNANGWYRGPVTLTWIVSEPQSPSSLEKSGCDDQAITADQVATTYSCSASSAGGPANPVQVSIKKDSTAPTNVAFVGGPEAGGRYFPITVPTAPTCTADDTTSLLASCVVTGYVKTAGTHTLTATATDNAGNVTTAQRTYTVRNLTYSGFFAPVDKGIHNTIKGGNTVPLKFRVFDEGVEQTATSVVSGFSAKQSSCSGAVAEDAVEEFSTNATGLRYDATAGHFIQNWKTPAKAGLCYQVSVTLIDGTSITAEFKTK
jgi:hypothetical protein